MEVIHCLPTVFSRIYHRPEALLLQTKLLGQLPDNSKEVSHQVLIFFRQIHKGGHMPFRDNQEMDWGLGVDVLDGQNVLILIYYLSRNLPCCDTTKDTLRHAAKHPPPLADYWETILSLYLITHILCSGSKFLLLLCMRWLFSFIFPTSSFARPQKKTCLSDPTLRRPGGSMATALRILPLLSPATLAAPAQKPFCGARFSSCS